MTLWKGKDTNEQIFCVRCSTPRHGISCHSRMFRYLGDRMAKMLRTGGTKQKISFSLTTHHGKFPKIKIRGGEKGLVIRSVFYGFLSGQKLSHMNTSENERDRWDRTTKTERDSERALLFVSCWWQHPSSCVRKTRMDASGTGLTTDTELWEDRACMAVYLCVIFQFNTLAVLLLISLYEK